MLKLLRMKNPALRKKKEVGLYVKIKLSFFPSTSYIKITETFFLSLIVSFLCDFPHLCIIPKILCVMLFNKESTSSEINMNDLQLLNG